MTPGYVVAVAFWALFVMLLGYGLYWELRHWWERRREARQVEVLNRAWSIPSREPIRTKLP